MRFSYPIWMFVKERGGDLKGFRGVRRSSEFGRWT